MAHLADEVGNAAGPVPPGSATPLGNAITHRHFPSCRRGRERGWSRSARPGNGPSRRRGRERGWSRSAWFGNRRPRRLHWEMRSRIVISPLADEVGNAAGPVPPGPAMADLALQTLLQPILLASMAVYLYPSTTCTTLLSTPHPISLNLVLLSLDATLIGQQRICRDGMVNINKQTLPECNPVQPVSLSPISGKMDTSKPMHSSE
jgi:hypothetical protein